MSVPTPIDTAAFRRWVDEFFPLSGYEYTNPWLRQIADELDALRAEVAALKARRAALCKECDGAGMVPDPTRAPVEWMGQTWEALVFCAECHGTGVVLALVCQACKGSGEVETDTVLNYDAADGSYTVPRGTCWECGGTGAVWEGGEGDE